MEKIIQSINNTYKMRQESLNKLTSELRSTKITKKSILIEPFTKNKNIYFIEKGVGRSFIIIEGKEVTTWFAKEGQLLYSTNSYYGKRKGYENEYVQMLEDSLLYYLPIDELDQLCNEDLDIANWLRILYKEAFLATDHRLINRLYMSAEERYKEFVMDNNDLFQRVNLGYIASFIGISHVTLCALRKKGLFL